MLMHFQVKTLSFSPNNTSILHVLQSFSYEFVNNIYIQSYVCLLFDCNRVMAGTLKSPCPSANQSVRPSAVRKMICSKGLRASPKNYYGNTTPSMASSHHWRNVWRNIAGSWPNWAQDFTRTSQKNNRTSQKNNYSRNFSNFLIITYHSYW